MVEGLGLSHLRETDWEAGETEERAQEGLADGRFPGECSNPEPEILWFHPFTSNLPPVPSQLCQPGIRGW